MKCECLQASNSVRPQFQLCKHELICSRLLFCNDIFLNYFSVSIYNTEKKSQSVQLFRAQKGEKWNFTKYYLYSKFLSQQCISFIESCTICYNGASFNVINSVTRVGRRGAGLTVLLGSHLDVRREV